MSFLRKTFELLRETAVGFGKDHGSMLAASLAYYTIFAMAPLLVIAVAVAGFVFREAAAEGQIVTAIQDTVGREAAVVIEQLIANAGESEAGTTATIISTALLFLGASGLFGQLQRALNIIWDTTPETSSGIVGVLRKRLLSFGMVLLMGVLLLISLTASTVINALSNFLESVFPIIGPLLPTLEVVASFLLLILLFALLFRLLPDADVAWRDVFLGAAVTAVFFSIGEYLIGLYLSQGTVGSTYGAAGSLVTILLWIYYSAQIVLFGAEFTQTYANKYGSKLKAADEAVVPLTPPQVDFPALPESPLASVPSQVDTQRKTGDLPRHQLERQIATGLLGIAFGLLIAFLNGKRQTPRNLPPAHGRP